MPEFVIWLVAGIVGIPSLVILVWPIPRYKNVTRNTPEKP